MYTFPMNITNEKLADEVINKGSKVALYGRYPFGDGYIEQLLDAGVRVSALFDSSYSEQDSQKILQGIKVSSPEKLKEYKGILIICGNGHYWELEEYARECGVTSILPYYFLYSHRGYSIEEYKNIYQIVNVANTHYIKKNYPEKVFINSLELAITHRCTLNCEKCANMISYFESPKDADYESMKDSIYKILNANVYVSELRILGGEPFLNQELVKYLQLLQQFDNIGLISIMSNGTLYPSKELTDCLRQKNVYVTLSDYGYLSKNLQKIKELFEKEGILYRIYEMSGWKDCNTIEYIEMDTEELERKFGNCSVNNCYTLHNGFLYRCPYNAGVSILQAIPGNLRDALSISQLDSGMVEDALESFMKVKSSQICKFCKGRPKAVVDIEAARQIKYKHQYKKYDSIEG